ncbi:MAG: hypothetical protein M3169_17820 [Candidatus Eremiobacteraeota bacterium]|nr:hypothetical protein [Candidatus Eremiobacteraeota bacterium]
MLIISGCGRQVTGLNAPNGTALLPEGQTLIRFDTAGQLDFANVAYLIVLNTSGNDQQPTAQGYNSDFKNWSYFFIVGGSAGVATNPPLYQIYQDPVSGGSKAFQLTYPSNSVNFQATIPSGNSAFGFQITFNRCLLDQPVPSASPPPITSTNRVCPPYANSQSLWNVSLFTLDRASNPIDSLSTTNPNSADYKFDIETSVQVNKNYFKPATNTTLSNAGAQITGIEVFSQPPNGPVATNAPTATPSATPTSSATRAPP